MIPRRTPRQDLEAWWKGLFRPKKVEAPFDRLCRELGVEYDREECGGNLDSRGAADPGGRLDLRSRAKRPPIGPELVSALTLLHHHFAGRGWVGHTRLPSPHYGYLKHLLAGRCVAVVTYLARDKPPHYREALGLIKFVYDRPRPSGCVAGPIQASLYGWLQRELQKPQV